MFRYFAVKLLKRTSFRQADFHYHIHYYEDSDFLEINELHEEMLYSTYYMDTYISIQNTFLTGESLS